VGRSWPSDSKPLESWIILPQKKEGGGLPRNWPEIGREANELQVTSQRNGHNRDRAKGERP
jgi:hypothetical protein